MIHAVKLFLLGVFTLAAMNCSDSTSGGGNTDPNWDLPQPPVGGGVPKDGIVALSSPDVVLAAAVDFLKDEDIVVGVVANGVARAYPHLVMDRHEIANDRVGGVPIALTYCPLTGTAIGWSRVINGSETTFGVSGLLFNSNLIPYDRLTDSNWSQMLNQCVNGELSGTAIETFTVVETSWNTWKEMYPDTEVLSFNQGLIPPSFYFGRLYGTYHVNNNLIFNVVNEDKRLPRKERVVGVRYGSESKSYRISQFSEALETINDTVAGTEVIAIGSSALNLGMVYERRINGTVLDFTPVENELPVVMMDNEGNKWDIMGVAVEGPRTGQQLVHPDSYIGYWFAWSAFAQGTIIHDNASPGNN